MKLYVGTPVKGNVHLCSLPVEDYRATPADDPRRQTSSSWFAFCTSGGLEKTQHPAAGWSTVLYSLATLVVQGEELPGPGDSLFEAGALLTALNKIPASFLLSTMWGHRLGSLLLHATFVCPERSHLDQSAHTPSLGFLSSLECCCSLSYPCVLHQSCGGVYPAGWMVWFWLYVWWHKTISQPHMMEKTTTDRLSCRQSCSDKWEENTARQSNKHCNPLSRICRAVSE